MKKHNRSYEALEKLFSIMELLRKDCPWDKEQTFTTLVPHSIEEIYELADAIRVDNLANIKEELGDMFMHLVFYVLIAEENNSFSFDEILGTINRKLIFRHPHIFENNKPLKSSKEVLEQWQSMKKKEGKLHALSGIAKGLPAITKAMRIQQKASDNKFDFANIKQVLAKCDEEMTELNKAVANQTNVEEELGDVLFAYINYARFLNIDPELALQKSNQKFMDRFAIMEEIVMKSNSNIADTPFEKHEQLWQQAKQELKNKQR